MKFIIVFAALFAVAMAAPATDEVKVLRQDSEVGPVSYKNVVELSNGISAQESGVIEDLGTEDEAIAVRGSYSYVGDDGVTYTVNYVADKNGFQPSGAHLPVAPVA